MNHNVLHSLGFTDNGWLGITPNQRSVDDEISLMDQPAHKLLLKQYLFWSEGGRIALKCSILPYSHQEYKNSYKVLKMHDGK